MLNGFLVDEREYSDYASDYSHLGNILTDIGAGIKSVVSNLFTAVKPAAPAIAYRAFTGREMPPSQVMVQAPAEQKTPLTTYLMYGGAALVAGLLIMKLAKKR